MKHIEMMTSPDIKKAEIHEMIDRLEKDARTRSFLAENPVVARIESQEIDAEGVVEVLKQYTRLPEVIISLLRAASEKFSPESGVRQELERNIDQEGGNGTGGVAHVDILKSAFKRYLGVDADVLTGSKETEAFITAVREGMNQSPSYALGQAFALEATAVPELARIVGPAINAAARLSGKEEPIVPAALHETEGEYPFPLIRDEAEAHKMPLSDWFAMHIRDFEVGHRDFLQAEAEKYFAEEGDMKEFRAGFEHVLDRMDVWWNALAA